MGSFREPRAIIFFDDWGDNDVFSDFRMWRDIKVRLFWAFLKERGNRRIFSLKGCACIDDKTIYIWLIRKNEKMKEMIAQPARLEPI